MEGWIEGAPEPVKGRHRYVSDKEGRVLKVLPSEGELVVEGGEVRTPEGEVLWPESGEGA